MDEMEELLAVKNLSVSIHTQDGWTPALKDISFSLKKGEVLAIVGESGCGKSILCKSLLRKSLLYSGFLTKNMFGGTVFGGSMPRTGGSGQPGKNAKIKSGQIVTQGHNLTRRGEPDRETFRDEIFSMVLQEPMSVLSPTVTVGEQIGKAVTAYKGKMKEEELTHKVMELMKLAGIDRPKELCELCPPFLSGGVRQRCEIAMALAGSPKVLLADNPAPLDAVTKGQILDLLCAVQKAQGGGLILFTHDLGAAARIADKMAVMYGGRIVEIGKTDEIFYDARHPYTWGLMRSLPAFAKPEEDLYTIPGRAPTLKALGQMEGEDAFAQRNKFSLPIDHRERPPMFQISSTHYAATWLLDMRAPEAENPVSGGGIFAPDYYRQAYIRKRLQRMEQARIHPEGSGNQENEWNQESTCFEGNTCSERNEGDLENVILDVSRMSCRFAFQKKYIPGVEGISFQVRKGEIFGLVGESGSGKSTIARCIMKECQPFEGKIRYQGIDIWDEKQVKVHQELLRNGRQMIAQNGDAFFNPHMKVVRIIEEAMKARRVKPSWCGTETPGVVNYRQAAEFWLRAVGMDASYLDQTMEELSGGMQARITIAKALSLEPELLVADEPVSSVDASTQARILNLFRHLQKEQGMTMLLITHELAEVRYLCDRMGVMYQGSLVEIGPTEELFKEPVHPYTKLLLGAMQTPDPRFGRMRKAQAVAEDELYNRGIMVEVSEGHFALERRL